MVVRPGIVKVRVPVLVVCGIIVPVGPTGEVELEKEDELPPVGPTGKLEPVPYAGRLSVPERGRLETGSGGNGPYG